MKKIFGDKNTPAGEWGVYCEPLAGQMRSPEWVSREPSDYESAFKYADFMNRTNHAWLYYAKPIMVKK